MDARNVFVIHGRNEAARSAMFAFLRSLNLNPLSWSAMVEATGQGTPYTGEVLDAGLKMAQAVVALMTPDDEARLLKPLQTEEEPHYESKLTPQPRQNVILEAGMALGVFRGRTIIVEVGRLRPMSDTIGRHVIRLNNSIEKRMELYRRLKTAGCSAELHGKDWETEGDFVGCLKNIEHVSASEDDMKFLNYLDGLTGDELFWLARPVVNRFQTIHAYAGDIAPISLISKGLLERLDYEPPYKKAAIPFNIPMVAWRYLVENEEWLLDQAIKKNQDRSDRLVELHPWLQGYRLSHNVTDSIQEILAKNKLLHVRLTERYPFGWILFHQQLGGKFVPFPVGELQCDADWSQTELDLDTDKKKYYLTLPELHWHRERRLLNIIEGGTSGFSGTYEIGTPMLLSTRVWAEGEPLIHLEILDDTARAPVFVIGFKKQPPGSGPPTPI